MRASSATALALGLMLAALSDRELSAHRRDELLQAARIGIEPRRVELWLALTPGIEVAETILAELDRDRDGALSAEERQGFADRVLGAAALDLDGTPVRVVSIDAQFPDLHAIRRGEGTIALHAASELPPRSNGRHRLSFRNGYRRELSVYLANALVPENPRVAVVAQLRDRDQHDLAVDFVLRGSALSGEGWRLSGFAAAAFLAALLASVTLGQTGHPRAARRRDARGAALGSASARRA